MAIILAINGFNVLTGEPENEPENHHYEEHHEEHWLDWRESAKVVGVEHKINFQHLDAEDLLFSAESFDGIFMYDTLQHIQNKEIALNECIRVIKPDCIICIIEWNKKSIEADYNKYGFKIDLIDPRDFLNRDDISIGVIKGRFVNFFILRKI